MMMTKEPAEPTQAAATIEAALEEIKKTSSTVTDGKWLEHLTVKCAPLIADWDVNEAWLWQDWPDRQTFYKNTADIGIDVVARRSNEDGYVAIQCKSRKLDDQGHGRPISKRELDSFVATSSASHWQERWLVVNGAVEPTGNATAMVLDNPVTLINLEKDLVQQQYVLSQSEPEPCPHCENESGLQTRDCMQNEAINKSVCLLKKQAQTTGNGRARGRIILPCGTGKSRIALRIIEELTEPGQVSAILCPSIALVAQLRWDFLVHRRKRFHVLAVCSDQSVTVAYRKKETSLANEPTADIGSATADEIKGIVTTDPQQIGDWIDRVKESGKHFGVIFGTYQSSHRIADALSQSGRQVQVMIADEAHRTAGLRRVRKVKEDKLRDFTVCHDDERFPAKYRIYQTATPKVYNIGENNSVAKNDNWVVRDMADSKVFGVELYRQSYSTAVANKWLSDYRIIAIGVNDKDAYDTANRLEKPGSKLTTAHYLRGLVLALVMGGALKDVDIRSSINFMNMIAKSKEMTDSLHEDFVRSWVQRTLDAKGTGSKAANYCFEHLDASSKVAMREKAKVRLMSATPDNPYGIINVNIFGEGVDAPSLSAVGFLEPRKSPVEVIQAVGRVMRRSVEKDTGYIICPIIIPPNADAETWLRNSKPEDGWSELGEILLALRAHDSRIEDQLSELMKFYLPKPPKGKIDTFFTIGIDEQRLRHFLHRGEVGQALKAIKSILSGEDPISADCKEISAATFESSEKLSPTLILSGKRTSAGNIEIREASVVRKKPAADGSVGEIEVKKTKTLGRKMVNGDEGKTIYRFPPPPPPPQKGGCHIRRACH